MKRTTPTAAIRYRGRRCVVTGAASEVGAALVRELVALDAEVHVIDRAPVDIAGVASRTSADVDDGDDARAAATRIGPVVDCVFDCAALERDAPSAFVAACASTLAPHSVVVVPSSRRDAPVDELVDALLEEGARP